MPELPEVETIVSDLRPLVVGQHFVDIKSSHKNHVKGALKNVDYIKGVKVVAVERRGKFINIFFANDYVMTIHLKMSGRLIWRGTDESSLALDDKTFDAASLKYERTKIIFDKGILHFCDLRKFGRVWICKISEYENVTGISRLGVEPLSNDFTMDRFSQELKKKKGIVKKWLLDQRIVAGIGNIYADEGCFYAGIRPNRRLETLENKEFKRLFEGILKALKQGVKNRGTSISDFADAYGISGRNQEVLYVYGRGGESCLKCGEKLEKIKVVQRGTVFCRKCQK